MVVRQDRKEQILDKAVDIFAELGYYKTTTARVAKEAGVTQPYVFHFFSSKEELFIAVVDRAVGRIADAFSQVEAPADQLMETMGIAFENLMHTYRAETLLVMQSYTIAEPAIREHMRERFSTIFNWIIKKFTTAGLPEPEVAASQFMSMGFLITVAEVLDLPQMLSFKDCYRDELQGMKDDTLQD
ncbi:TetR/AcrR family transcriptional regulator [Paenibacillus sp. VCA1]|uniref:TetR/AcrR family transcriptional regulator n=1 Tax=Paenibacillus sp. VCA1 TaxID=3039148 RepID=UPI0028725B93|nr:TetR/AcrR family transcriptional regulator [Paenibacillus sp. VCA1]MDR9855683.1 TetR/AcrR family transcriptional regulator [Paenibacillus sp. VCA1]